ncbi:coenzyme F420 biosynthesis-associated protein [Nakamurella sp. YIM 132087]|uniref:Coenzyme F420 biosynthesis-associated protein n=1 Tax=Nakamurella alba TaxID=2665158 RepID=A0A7K1FK78_9ACTN|nr:zinc-dependent metalloprotease [Nakamurella alba]MTD14541.1 coenzyme F420 biosynthesis-associated protein [Nakamurella alba]
MTGTAVTPPATVIDWAAAVRAGQRFAPTGPSVTPDEARQVVADLREFSVRAERIVREVTLLGTGLPIGEALVVDRRHWVEATAEGMAILAEPLAARLSEKLTEKLAEKAGDTGKPAKPGKQRGSGAAGTQLGAVLGFLSGRVLGQYDPLAGVEADGTPGRLLLVAPNIVKVERELGADPEDFRMWVCLHESTHRLQFTAVPWLREYFRGLAAEFAETSDVDAGEMLRRASRALGSGGSWIERIQTPEQRVVFDRMMALMTLLEGHADHVMDAVGPSVVPSVASIREGFSERRRKGRGPVDRLIRAMLGMDMKLAQYIKGAAFVSTVVEEVGMARFNLVWSSPETLPTREETTDPAAWIRRVLG